MQGRDLGIWSLEGIKIRNHWKFLIGPMHCGLFLFYLIHVYVYVYFIFSVTLEIYDDADNIFFSFCFLYYLLFIIDFY